MAHRPAHDDPRVKVQHRPEIQPALIGIDLGVSNPLDIKRISLEVVLEVVLDADWPLPGRPPTPACLLWTALDTINLPQSGYPVHAAGLALMARIIPDAWSTQHTITLGR